eukprot:tig00000147_g9506.t1
MPFSRSILQSTARPRSDGDHCERLAPRAAPAEAAGGGQGAPSESEAEALPDDPEEFVARRRLSLQRRIIAVAALVPVLMAVTEYLDGASSYNLVRGALCCASQLAFLALSFLPRVRGPGRPPPRHWFLAAVCAFFCAYYLPGARLEEAKNLGLSGPPYAGTLCFWVLGVAPSSPWPLQSAALAAMAGGYIALKWAHTSFRTELLLQARSAAILATSGAMSALTGYLRRREALLYYGALLARRPAAPPRPDAAAPGPAAGLPRRPARVHPELEEGPKVPRSRTFARASAAETRERLAADAALELAASPASPTAATAAAVSSAQGAEGDDGAPAPRGPGPGPEPFAMRALTLAFASPAAEAAFGEWALATARTRTLPVASALLAAFVAARARPRPPRPAPASKALRGGPQGVVSTWALMRAESPPPGHAGRFLGTLLGVGAPAPALLLGLAWAPPLWRRLATHARLQLLVALALLWVHAACLAGLEGGYAQVTLPGGPEFMQTLYARGAVERPAVWSAFAAALTISCNGALVMVALRARFVATAALCAAKLALFGALCGALGPPAGLPRIVAGFFLPFWALALIAARDAERERRLFFRDAPRPAPAPPRPRPGCQCWHGRACCCVALSAPAPSLPDDPG